MDQTHRTLAPPTTNSLAFEYHLAQEAIVELFNLYLGISSHQRPDDESIQESPNKLQKLVRALSRDLPPTNEQFLQDFVQLQTQFPDQYLLRSVTEAVLISLVVQCSSHASQSEFLPFALRSLCSIGYINWDTFLPFLLSSVSSADLPAGQGSPTMPAGSSTNSSLSGMPPPSSTIPNSSRKNAISSLRQLCCKIVLNGLEFNLKPVTHAEIFHHMLNWLVNWDLRQEGVDEIDTSKSWRSDKPLIAWLHSCLDVIWLLVDEAKCRVPFYELLRSNLQFIENIPDDEALFTPILEIRRRRKMMAMYMQMLDQNLHCPTFGNHWILTQTTPTISGEAGVRSMVSPITYFSGLGEPLHGEDVATSIQKGSLDWERALRCLKHALRTTPSPDWWSRLLVLAPCYGPASQGPTPGSVFTSEMICEATIDRIVELLKLTNSETNHWQDWLVFSDTFFFLMKRGCIDFVDFVDKLVSRLTEGDSQILKTNQVTWLLAQIIQTKLVMDALKTDTRKVETIKKILSFHRGERILDRDNPQSILLALVSRYQNRQLLSLNTSTREYMNTEQPQERKQLDEWWRQLIRDRMMDDYMNMDARSTGMFWVASYAIAQHPCQTVMNWLTSAGATKLILGPDIQMNVILVATEVSPLPMSLLCGFSMDLCMTLCNQLEESLFSGQVIPSIAMVETYTRLLLLAPHSLFRLHFSHLAQRNPSLLNKPGVKLLLLEILNYRLLPLYRYQGQGKALMYDVTKIVSTLKVKQGDHRLFRLAENLCLNLIFSLRDSSVVKREGKGPAEFTETLNRATVITLAILIKTRGIADADDLLYLPAMLKQIMATSHHTWSEKTKRHFPSVLREALGGEMDKRCHLIEAWQQAEAAVINQCTQLLSPSADPSYVMTYINHSALQQRQYLCAGAWILMYGHAENINSENLACVLREISPGEVTSNIYNMVDVLLHVIQMELQQGHSLQDLLSKACASLAFFIWNNELLPLDILLLALIDRDDDAHALGIAISLLERPELQLRVALFCMNRGPPEHWLYSGLYTRVELQEALGNHLSWKERYPVFFDDIAARLLPVIPLVTYRLIENDAMEPADRILAMYSTFLAYYPLRFTFVHDILAYFYGHLPAKLIVRIINVLDISKIPFSESFLQLVSSSNPIMCPPMDYFATLLLRIVNNVIPPLPNNLKSGMGDTSNNAMWNMHDKPPTASQSGPANDSEGQKAFYQIQDPGTCTQLYLETAVIEILSLPLSAFQIVQSLVQIIINIQPILIHSSYGIHGGSNGGRQNFVLPTSSSGGSTDSLSASRSTPLISGIDTSVSRSGYTCQQLSSLLIQACGLLLAQLPPDFHLQLYMETTRVIKENWWLAYWKRSLGEIESAVGYALLDATSAVQDNTSTVIGKVVTLLHSFFSNLPQEWLEGTHVIIEQLRPVTSVAMLRIAFRIMGPLLPKFANAPKLFNKTLSLLLSVLVDVYGKNSQPSTAVKASEITDIIDFLHHIVHYEGRAGPVQGSSKPRPEVLALIESAMESLQPDIQHLLSHLKLDGNSSIYAAASHHV